MEEAIGQLKKELNEQYLLSGVPAAVIANVMTSGMNERYSGSNAGSMFGEGVSATFSALS